jgi:Uma2 family endonuclease
MSAAKHLDYYPPLLSVAFPRKYTVEEYLEIEAQSEHKLEYVNGYIVPKFAATIKSESGGSFTHTAIGSNTLIALHYALKGKPCKVYGSDFKVKTDKGLRFPDVFVVCGEPKFFNDKQYALTNPTILVEIVSPESSIRDYVNKRLEYLNIESLQHYIIIEQTYPLVSVFSKNKDGLLVFADYNAENPTILLPNLDITLSLEDIYADIAFG